MEYVYLMLTNKKSHIPWKYHNTDIGHGLFTMDLTSRKLVSSGWLCVDESNA